MHRDGDERRLLGCGAGEVGEMTDDGRDMWVNCKSCGHEWVALRLPMEMSKAAKVMIKLHCPNCAADAKQIRVGKGKTDG
jgi:Zn finger protein HypA/HybF involved in hydrogenase expression